MEILIMPVYASGPKPKPKKVKPRKIKPKKKPKK
tara:strand:- start:846 stop:947 length:102 start_codon:yes stop_codon:yes gene_type:complete